MHIFLTGDIQAGKSTVIKRTLPLLGLKYGGFFTGFGQDRKNPDRFLYINDAAGPDVYEEKNAVAVFRSGQPPEALTERFNRLGSAFLLKARDHAQLIIMDECGYLEKDADVFQGEILRILDGDIPVLGAIRRSASGWTEKIRAHPRVMLVEVNEISRDRLPDKLRDILKKSAD
jgi:nucleoside-triphosphatase